MEREEWLKKMRAHTEALYDHFAPAYWVTFGLYDDGMHHQFIEKVLERLGAHSTLLDAGCGAGRYDGMLVEAGHRVLGIDQSEKMLARAREHFPEERFPGLRYVKMGLQEMDFGSEQAEFDGMICVDAMEHVSPQDWPGIVDHFQKALKPGGVLYLTVEVADWGEVGEAYERAKAQGLPVVFGEVVDQVDTASAQVEALDWQEISGELSDQAVYHYYPDPEQVRVWLDQAGLEIEEEGTGLWYTHLLARKKG
jgi:2-polyprenyl-3-methyl-5-hydroxy-6-metoxy-1,4-benzoquinol methylase